LEGAAATQRRGPTHAGKGWLYLAVDDLDAHYERTKTAGVEVLGEPPEGPGGSRGYSAREPEGNVWTFGTTRPTP
jgi:predicted enzyme related to lactoylglutathione lyase